MKVGSKWKCKVSTCIVAYPTKWLLTAHLKEVHGLMAEKAKPRKPSTFERNLRHQNQAKMNICILGNAMAVQRQNDQKIVNPLMPKPKTSGISWKLLKNNVHHYQNQFWSN
jgi:hypothetical protein